MERVIPHAFRLVEEGILTEGQFRDFTFTNPARLHSTLNPGFFDDTPIADAVRASTANA